MGLLQFSHAVDEFHLGFDTFKAVFQVADDIVHEDVNMFAIKTAYLLSPLFLPSKKKKKKKEAKKKKKKTSHTRHLKDPIRLEQIS